MQQSHQKLKNLIHSHTKENIELAYILAPQFNFDIDSYVKSKYKYFSSSVKEIKSQKDVLLYLIRNKFHIFTELFISEENLYSLPKEVTFTDTWDLHAYISRCKIES